ncbi:MAG: MFS transporter [Patescibacteria group bacterium]
MLKEQFLGRNPTHFQVNPIVKAFIVSEAFLWSAYNFVIPLFAVFVLNNIRGGNVQIAASAYSFFLIVRVVFELITCKYFGRSNEFNKFITTMAGMLFISLGYLGFAFSNGVMSLFVFFGIVGMGLGIASPVKNSLFATHLDKNKETTEWGIYDAVTFIGMASTAALGGFIASAYGFNFLFILASVVNFVGILPYLLYIRHK